MNELARASEGQEPERFNAAMPIELGQWYWVDKDDEEYEPWLGCVMGLGSNYIELRSSPVGRHKSYHVDRVHLDEFSDRCTYEADAKAIIRAKVHFYKEQTQQLLAQIRDITANLGVGQATGIEQGSETRSLSTIGATAPDMRAYKKSLIKAKEKTLPDLFEEVEDSNANLVSWMSAEVLPMMAKVGTMDGCIEAIEERIFHVELYAGLTEEVKQIQKGDPAGVGEKVHLMQGRLYMDEECLIDYDAGGMEFQNIRAFDKWLLRPHNLAALLPHQRCMAAFQVRRKDKERGSVVTLHEAMVRVSLEQQDKTTFFYLRNGQQVFRLSTQAELREKLFPDVHEFKFDEALMARIFGNSVDKVMSKREFDELRAASDEKDRLGEIWAKENPGEHWMHNPHRGMSSEFDGRNWQPFDQTSVYFDDVKKSIEDDMKSYNRIILILQGLLDRSPVFAPHMPAKLWSAADFGRSVQLVYDRDRALYAGEKPDYEAFRDQLNQSMKPGCVVIGVQRVWRDRQKVKEKRDYNGHVIYRYERHPDPGPSFLMTVSSIKGDKVTCEYIKPRQKGVKRSRYSDYTKGLAPGDPMKAAITVSKKQLLNATAYTPGDYKLFFADPRTRAEYIKWAPFLLGAEDFHAGKRVVGSDDIAGKKKPHHDTDDFDP